VTSSRSEVSTGALMLVFDGVTKRYARPSGEIVALEAVSFDVGERELFTVLGAENSGKSTLLRLAAGVEWPDAGSVRFRGRDTRELRRRERTHMLRHELGCVFAPELNTLGREAVDFVTWPLISANVPLRQATARAVKMLSRVGAEACAGATLAELSTSERTRVTIAQACVRDPLMLLVDEPANTLESDETDNILALLRSIAVERGMAVLMTVGDATQISGTTRVATLSAGSLRVRPPRSGEIIEGRFG
jgi:ABC-type methionine transport system ATPase subunit